jgi:hypothetical protein
MSNSGKCRDQWRQGFEGAEIHLQRAIEFQTDSGQLRNEAKGGTNEVGANSLDLRINERWSGRKITKRSHSRELQCWFRRWPAPKNGLSVEQVRRERAAIAAVLLAFSHVARVPIKARPICC